MVTSHWSGEAIASIREGDAATAVIRPDEVATLIEGLDLWDFWPVCEEDGRVAGIGGGTLFVFLSAPRQADPDHRHALARLRLLHLVRGGWHDLGPMLPDGLSPGSREWAGCTVVSPDHSRLTLYFTAAGRRGEDHVTFEQRLFETSAELATLHERPAVRGWTVPAELFAPDGHHYQVDMDGGGDLGTIKAFRDPSFFRNPRDGADHLLFTASLAQSASMWNGAIGLAQRKGGVWSALPPIIEADCVNNELERPHVVCRDDLYYCFWSTQRKVFAVGGPSGPDGLYGMVSGRLDGPWTPLNGSGLVLANPPEAPHQAYSWLVLPDLSVLSFADSVGVGARPPGVAAARAAFGGSPAPPLRIGLRGDRAWLEQASPGTSWPAWR